jgi:hypothetical protein
MDSDLMDNEFVAGAKEFKELMGCPYLTNNEKREARAHYMGLPVSDYAELNMALNRTVAERMRGERIMAETPRPDGWPR